MSASMLGFVVNDTLTKSVSDELSLFQVVLVRGLFATALILLIAWRAGALRYRPTPKERVWMSWRVLGEVLGTCFFLTALFNMPIANAVAILQCVGLVVTLAAALLLGDQVGWRRYLAILIGLCGVLLIVRPGTEVLLKLIAAAAFVLVGYNAGVQAMRVGEVGFVSPFRYLNLLWAMVLGYLVFGDLPGPITMLGAALIVATGVYTLHRERVTGQAAAKREPGLRP